MSNLIIRTMTSDHWSPRAGQTIQFYIVHGTDGPVGTTLNSAAQYLKHNDRGVSAHELVGGATVYRMVDDAKAAHHCYFSKLPNGATGKLANQRTWGIEGLQIHGIPMDAVTRRTLLIRVAEAMKRNGHGVGDVYTRVLGHRDIDQQGKTCPGPAFDMDQFRFDLVEYMAPSLPALLHKDALDEVEASRWHSEEAVREIERGETQAARERLLTQVIPVLQRLEKGEAPK